MSDGNAGQMRVPRRALRLRTEENVRTAWRSLHREIVAGKITLKQARLELASLRVGLEAVKAATAQRERDQHYREIERWAVKMGFLTAAEQNLKAHEQRALPPAPYLPSPAPAAQDAAEALPVDAPVAAPAPAPGPETPEDVR